MTKIGGMFALLFLATAAFVVADTRYSVVEGTFNYADRKGSDIAYWWFYKAPTGGSGLASLAEIPRSIPFFSRWFENSGKSGTAAYAAERERALSVPVLIYHGTPPEGNDNSPLPISVFIDQMRALKDAGWHTVTIKEFEGFVKRGEALPDRSFLLTFDDGRKESFYPVDPVLRDLGFNGVMYVITEFSLENQIEEHSTFYLSENELRYMAESGRWELESHGDRGHRFYAVPTPDGASTTVGHFYSNKFWIPEESRLETNAEFTERIKNDISRSDEILENLFGRKIDTFAFPFSDFGQDTINFPGAEQAMLEVMEKLYPIAFYQTWNANGDTFNYPDPGEFMFRRIEPLAEWDGKKLLSLLEAGRAQDLPYRGASFESSWLDTWGDVVPGEKNLRLAANKNTTGAAAFLNGSGAWEDYLYTAEFEWESGNNVSLMARYRNNSNYLACAYANGRVSLQEQTSTGRTTLAVASHEIEDEGVVSLTMGVRGRVGICYANGESVVSGTITNPLLVRGGVGMQIWDSEFGKASINLTGIDVRKI